MRLESLALLANVGIKIARHSTKNIINKMPHTYISDISSRAGQEVERPLAGRWALMELRRDE